MVTDSKGVAQPTRGPFAIQQAPSSLVHVYDSRNRLVARFGGGNTGIDEDWANATAYVAAPYLLAALEKSPEHVEGCKNVDPGLCGKVCRGWQELRANAIAKAKGGN